MEILVLTASVTTIPRSSVFKLVIVDDRVEPFHATHLTPLAVDGGASLRAAGEAWCTAQSIDAAACAESLFTATASQLRAPEAAESFGLGECASNAAAAESQRAAAMDDPSVACDDVGACDCADASHVFNGQRCIAAAEAPAQQRRTVCVVAAPQPQDALERACHKGKVKQPASTSSLS